MEFGELLRQHREEAGLSQNAFAHAAGIDPTNLNRMERGKQGSPRKSTLLKLVRALGWSLNDARAQRLFAAAGVSASSAPLPTAMLAAPHREEGPTLDPAVRALRTALLRALDALAEVEERAKEMERS